MAGDRKTPTRVPGTSSGMWFKTCGGRGVNQSQQHDSRALFNQALQFGGILPNRTALEFLTDSSNEGADGGSSSGSVQPASTEQSAEQPDSGSEISTDTEMQSVANPTAAAASRPTPAMPSDEEEHPRTVTPRALSPRTSRRVGREGSGSRPAATRSECELLLGSHSSRLVQGMHPCCMPAPGDYNFQPDLKKARNSLHRRSSQSATRPATTSSLSRRLAYSKLLDDMRRENCSQWVQQSRDSRADNNFISCPDHPNKYTQSHSPMTRKSDELKRGSSPALDDDAWSRIERLVKEEYERNRQPSARNQSNVNTFRNWVLGFLAGILTTLALNAAAESQVFSTLVSSHMP